MPPLPRLLLFTDAATCLRRGRGVVASVARALAGVDAAGRVAVVVRHKQDAVFARALCEAVAPICRKASALVFAHGDAAAVAALDLDGVHLTSTQKARAARLRLPPGRLLGQSRHAGDVDAGADDDALDYVTLSPVFSPSSKPGDERPTLGVAALSGRRHPTFALGGVDDKNARACVAHGAAGVAVVGAVFSAHDPRRALLALLERMG